MHEGWKINKTISEKRGKSYENECANCMKMKIVPKVSRKKKMLNRFFVLVSVIKGHCKFV